MMKRKSKKIYNANYKIDKGVRGPNKTLVNGIQNDKSHNNNEKIATAEWIRKDVGDLKLLDVEQVDPFFREPFIISAYRKCGSSAWYCVKSLFQGTNETINIWSHFLALAVFLLRFASVFAKHSPLQDSHVYPLLCFAFGICIMLVMSAGAHLFNCMSIKARHVCFFLDYAAISVYTFTAGQVFYFYSRPVETEWIIFNTPALFLGISAAISFVSTFLCCHSFANRNRFDSFVKAGTYSISWLYNTSPYLTMLSLCNTSCSSAASIHYFARHCLFYAGGTLAYVSRIPERLMIGVFDVLGHSHHFLHILCSIGVADEFSAMELDMLERRAILGRYPGPTFANTILLTTVVVLGNIAAVLWSVKGSNMRKDLLGTWTYKKFQ